MKKLSKFIAVLAMMVFLLLPTRAAHAQGPEEPGKVVFGSSYTLKSGETLNGDLVVFGGNVTIEKDATVTGSVVVFGGTIQLEQGAEIQKDTAMIGGTMDVNGTVNGEIERDPKAQVDGDILENIPAPAVQIPTVVPGVPNAPNIPNVPPNIHLNFNPLAESLMVVIRALIVAGLAMLLTLFLQPQLERVSDAIIRQPVVAGGFGLLTAVLSPFVLLILVITIILIPVAFLALVVLPLAWLFGVIALGQEVGDRFAKAVNQTWAPVLATGVGTFLLMLIGGYIGMIPCVGWLLPFVIGLVAVGGVIMTIFGTRSAPGTLVQPVEVPPAS